MASLTGGWPWRSRSAPAAASTAHTGSPSVTKDPLVGLWQYHIFGVLPTDDEIVLGADGRFTDKGSASDDGLRIAWNREGRWAHEGDQVLLRAKADPGASNAPADALRIAGGFLYKTDDGRGEGRGIWARYLLKGRDFPEPPLVGERQTERELIGKYEFYSPLSPNGPRDPDRTLTIETHAHFQAVTKWSDGKGFYGTVKYEGTWTIEGDRIVLEATVWPQERHDPWPKREKYVTMKDGVLLYGEFVGLRGGAPYYKKVN